MERDNSLMFAGAAMALLLVAVVAFWGVSQTGSLEVFPLPEIQSPWEESFEPAEAIPTLGAMQPAPTAQVVLEGPPIQQSPPEQLGGFDLGVPESLQTQVLAFEDLIIEFDKQTPYGDIQQRVREEIEFEMPELLDMTAEEFFEGRSLEDMFDENGNLIEAAFDPVWHGFIVQWVIRYRPEWLPQEFTADAAGYWATYIWLKLRVPDPNRYNNPWLRPDQKPGWLQ